MVERGDCAGLASFFTEATLTPGREIRLDAGAARHARARRLRPGELVRLVDGRGRFGRGEIRGIDRDLVTVAVEDVVELPRPSTLEMIVPIADRDRMLLLGEKCVELQVTGWHPVRFARSRSVTTRGEGARFREKLAARMRGALEQCGGGWLPEIHEEASLGDALDRMPPGRCVVLDPRGSPMPEVVTSGAMVLAAGPEGGLEEDEVALLHERGWLNAALAATTLRFETALIAAAAIARAVQLSLGEAGTRSLRP